MAGRAPTTARARFDEKCNPAESGCIEWTGGVTQPGPKGYGLFYADGQMRPAHRWNYEDANGKQPAHIDVCHKCDNRKCINLDHLFAGTRQENMDDAVRKGRTSHATRKRGQEHGRAVLTDADVLKLREWHRVGWPMRILSDTFGVSFQSIHRIVNRKSWSHL